MITTIMKPFLSLTAYPSIIKLTVFHHAHKIKMFHKQVGGNVTSDVNKSGFCAYND